jgi:hypothetical protein
MGNALSGVEDLGADIDAAFFSLHAGVPQVGAMDEGDDPKYAPIGGSEKIGGGAKMKYIALRPFADPEAAARKLMKIASSIEPVQDGRIHIELINWPFLHELLGTSAENSAGLKFAIERGWLWPRESGTYVKFTQAGAELFA